MCTVLGVETAQNPYMVPVSLLFTDAKSASLNFHCLFLYLFFMD